MENLSPSRIQPLSSGEENNRDLARPKKQVKSAAALHAASGHPPVEAENEEKHQLDERA